MLLKWLAGSPIPARWFYPSAPPETERHRRTGPLHIEIVSHCWRYSRLLAYQLSSLVHHPVTRARITMTVYYSSEDEPTARLLQFIGQHTVSNVIWNWCELPKEQLFRRAIGRNHAALKSDADWLWFTDCDMTFQGDCLDVLNDELQARTEALVYPAIEAKTDVYTSNDLISKNEIDNPALLSAAEQDFSAHQVTRATGPLQITHGDVARAVGYCAAVSVYQKPAAHWQKCVEDRCFRWLLNTPGTPVNVPGVCRIQHAEKGRYEADSSRTSARRKRVRQWQHLWRGWRGK